MSWIRGISHFMGFWDTCAWVWVSVSVYILVYVCVYLHIRILIREFAVGKVLELLREWTRKFTYFLQVLRESRNYHWHILTQFYESARFRNQITPLSDSVYLHRLKKSETFIIVSWKVLRWPYFLDARILKRSKHGKEIIPFALYTSRPGLLISKSVLKRLLSSRQLQWAPRIVETIMKFSEISCSPSDGKQSCCTSRTISFCFSRPNFFWVGSEILCKLSNKD